jgi:uncharacterized membrane protein YoaK (UPF0700 family)
MAQRWHNGRLLSDEEYYAEERSDARYNLHLTTNLMTAATFGYVGYLLGNHLVSLGWIYNPWKETVVFAALGLYIGHKYNDKVRWIAIPALFLLIMFGLDWSETP